MSAPLSPELPRPDPEHESRAVAAMARAFAEIPYYEKLGRTPPAPGTPLDRALAAAPLLFKKDIRTTLPKQWVPKGRDAKAELAAGDIELVETSGSTGERLRVLGDKGWWLRQEARAMRTNDRVSALMDGAYREAILTTPACGLSTCHTGDLSFEERLDGHFLFLNMRQDPTYWRPEDMTRMLDELARHDTVGLESDPMYLAVLARHAASEGRKVHARGFCQLTYAFSTRAYERAIRKATTAPIVHLYGASEVGVLFMEGEDGRLHHAPFTTHVELLPAKVPTPGAKDVALVVATSMDRLAQPLVRFCLGDVVQVDRGGPRRFTTVPPLASVEGRLDDAIVRPDGALITAGALDRALEPIEAIELWQANQPRPDLLELDVVAGGEDVVAAVRARLMPLLPGVELVARTVTAIAAEPSGKFRVSKRHFPLDLARAFEGCESVKP
jgi:phenylacetate-coenzyme A ligase PaaK-like adenylate-forming protein